MDIFIILIYLLSFTCYTLLIIHLVKQALRLTRSGKSIAYLISVGAMINGVGMVFKELNILFSSSFILIGSLIFLFGFIQLLYKKFREGVTLNKR